MDTKELTKRVETIRSVNEQNKIKKAEKNVHLDNLKKQKDELTSQLKEKDLTIESATEKMSELLTTLESKITESEKILGISTISEKMEDDELEA